jgi:hypothetical protein
MSTMIEGEMRDLHVGNRQLATAVIASVLGWSLDLFDLFTLLYVAPVVGNLFFPSTQPMLSLAAVYASFAVTLLMRPVGSRAERLDRAQEDLSPVWRFERHSAADVLFGAGSSAQHGSGLGLFARYRLPRKCGPQMITPVLPRQ